MARNGTRDASLERSPSVHDDGSARTPIKHADEAVLARAHRSLRNVETRVVATAQKILYRLGLWTPRKLHAAASEFIAVNSKYWPAYTSVRRGRVLVEGHLAEYGPNYLFRTAVAARALQEGASLDIDVVFNGFGRRWATAKRVYRSFGIVNFVFLGSSFFTNLWRTFESFVVAARTAAELEKPEDILRIKYGGIQVGDLIYDDILKWSSLKTVERIDRTVRRALRRSYYYYLQYAALFDDRRYAYYVATHTAYSEYGILCRVALARGAAVIETTDIQMSYFDGTSIGTLPTYHDGIRNIVSKALGAAQSLPDSAYAAAKEALQRRLASQVKQLDAQKAYRGTIYDRTKLLEALGLPERRKVVFVLAHVFSDAPHLSSSMLHADYYRWLSSTLDICARVPEVNWIVKPHPSSDLYGETGLVEEIVAALDAANVRLSPRDLNTRSLEQCADALVTVHGTAGLEFACLGIPVVLAGTPFYSRFGFTIDPRSIEDYERALASLQDIAPLTIEQQRRAMHVYSVWEGQFDWHNPIITSDVLANVWGSERPRDLEAAYEIMTRHLVSADPRRIKLWSFVQSIASAS